MRERGKFMRIGTVAGAMAIAAVGALAAPTPASAHDEEFFKGRVCGWYLYRSSHNDTFHGTASTSERTGNCAGHSWVRVMRTNGQLINWQHRDGFVSISVLSGAGIDWSEHKSWEHDSVTRLSH